MCRNVRGEVVMAGRNRPCARLRRTIWIVLALVLRVAIVSRCGGETHRRVTRIIWRAVQPAIAIWPLNVIVTGRQTSGIELPHRRVLDVSVKVGASPIESSRVLADESPDVLVEVARPVF